MEGAGDRQSASNATERERHVRALEARVAELEALHRDAALEREGVVRLRELSALLVSQSGLATLLQAVVDAAIALAESDKGTLQLLDVGSGLLRLVAQRGFERPFRDHFQAVGHGQGSCGHALLSRHRVVVEDVRTSAFFRDTPDLEVLEAEGVRAVQSTPMIGRDGELLGMFSTHWLAPHRPSETNLRLLDLLSRVATDLIEHRQREQALRQSEGRLHEVLESITDAFVSLDLQWRYTYVNGQAARLLGLGIEELLGKTPWELFPFSVGNAVHRACLQAMAEQIPVHFEHYEPSIGRWFENHMYPSRRGLSIVWSDISQRKQADEALKASEVRYRSLYETMTEGCAMVEIVSGEEGQPVDLRYLDVNPAFERLTGLRAGDVRGRTQREVFPEAEPAWIDAYVSVALTGAPAHFEALLGPLGRSFEVCAYRTEPGRLGVVLFDITERRRAVEERQEFLAVLSHELRNPLAPIQNSIYVLGHAAPGGEQARRALEVIERQTDQLARLVDDLLDLTRLSRSKVQLQRERLELDELVRRAVEDQRSLFDKKGVRLALELASSPVFVDADRNRLAQIVGNLLQNAAKFTGPGGTATVSVTSVPASNVGCVRVGDSGVGISPELLEQIFEPFTQIERTLDRSTGGLGLGLALVKGLVELHGGTIRAHSAGLGRGAEFIVELPLVTAGASDSKVVVHARSRLRKRVLIIEDNDDAAQTLREVLELFGHEVTVAHDGPHGLARAREQAPEVVLCDIGLPGMDGYEVARRFREDQVLAKVRLVALSGYAQPEDLGRAADAGFDQHLAKPPDLELLEELLERGPPR